MCPSLLEKALRLIDQANRQDPRLGYDKGTDVPQELLYAQRLSKWIFTLNTQPSEALQIAARAMHICRWHIPRNHYAMDRQGYHQWRKTLQAFHAKKTREILESIAYPADTITRVCDLILKKHFPQDSESCILEDAVSLTFLQFQLSDFSKKTDDSKVIRILQKTWAKMTPHGQRLALELKYRPHEQHLIQQAVH